MLFADFLGVVNLIIQHFRLKMFFLMLLDGIAAQMTSIVLNHFDELVYLSRFENIPFPCNAKDIQCSQICNIMLPAIIQRITGIAACNDVLIVFAVNQTRAFSFSLDLFFKTDVFG